VTDRRTPPLSAAQDEAHARPSRWDGVLSAEQKAWCEANGIALAYDPVQIGWVIAEGEAERGADAPPAPISWHAGTEHCLGFRRWTEEDLPAYRQLLGDPEVWRYMHEDWPGEMTEALARDLIAISALRDHHDVLAATLDGMPIGQMRLVYGTEQRGHRRAQLLAGAGSLAPGPRAQPRAGGNGARFRRSRLALPAGGLRPSRQRGFGPLPSTRGLSRPGPPRRWLVLLRHLPQRLRVIRAARCAAEAGCASGGSSAAPRCSRAPAPRSPPPRR